MQAQQSDVQKGDRLIAVNDINTTTAPAKFITRILQAQTWPMVLVFQSAPPTVDTKKLANEAAKGRTFNMTVIYPPTLTGEYEVLLADWTPGMDIFHQDECTFYHMLPPKDNFGCQIQPDEVALRQNSLDIVRKKGKVSADLERYVCMYVCMYVCVFYE
jgi:hypothetical protein